MMDAQTLKPGWKRVKFGDIAKNVAVRVDPADAKTDVYVGLEHLDPSTLHLRQWGIRPMSPDRSWPSRRAM